MIQVFWNKRRLCFVAALLTLASACNRQDADRLGRISRKAVERTEALTGNVRDSLSNGWQGLCFTLEETAPAARVLARLRWDKSLTDTKIEVQFKEGAIELRGTVADLPKRRRAVELAESTVGVQKVIDQLQLPQSGP
jgi:hyperosmotically inducible periplasmic protein